MSDSVIPPATYSEITRLRDEVERLTRDVRHWREECGKIDTHLRMAVEVLTFASACTQCESCAFLAKNALAALRPSTGTDQQSIADALGSTIVDRPTKLRTHEGDGLEEAAREWLKVTSLDNDWPQRLAAFARKVLAEARAKWRTLEVAYQYQYEKLQKAHQQLAAEAHSYLSQLQETAKLRAENERLKLVVSGLQKSHEVVVESLTDDRYTADEIEGWLDEWWGPLDVYVPLDRFIRAKLKERRPGATP